MRHFNMHVSGREIPPKRSELPLINRLAFPISALLPSALNGTGTASHVVPN